MYVYDDKQYPTPTQAIAEAYTVARTKHEGTDDFEIVYAADTETVAFVYASHIEEANGVTEKEARDIYAFNHSIFPY